MKAKLNSYVNKTWCAKDNIQNVSFIDMNENVINTK